ncbi:hypothetical protein BLS_006819 [Venturia inaequalis]|uniref:Uncharacterized protein n=1 Tax=Venturia inaequalis TaxID=5025 RepID=A0A8H3YQR3_VENIN|nr:hypothetical protein BLS_006819 [Venturia inaequalis]
MAPWLSTEILNQVYTTIDPLAVQEYGGDTIIRFSERPEDRLLMNSKSLKKCSNWFQPRGDWELYGDTGPTNTLTSLDPLTNEYFPIYSYYMSGFIEEGYGLWLLHSDMGPFSSGLAPCMAICSDGEERSRKCKYAGPIVDTELTTNFVSHYSNQNWDWNNGDWEFDDIPAAYRAAVKEYKTMFCLMFGNSPCLNGQELGLVSADAGTDYARFRKLVDDDNETLWAITIVHAEHLANVAVRADYHGCLPAIACQIVSVVMALPRIWQAIAEEPRWWIGFAILLHADEIYAESLRYLVGSSCLTCAELPNCLEFNAKELSYEILRHRVPLAENNLKLRRELDLMSPKSNPAVMQDDRIDFLAQSIFSHWRIVDAARNPSILIFSDPQLSSWFELHLGYPAPVKDFEKELAAESREGKRTKPTRLLGRGSKTPAPVSQEAQSVPGRGDSNIRDFVPTAEEKLEARLFQLLKEAESLVENAMRQASYDLNAGLSKEPVRGKVEFWTNCLLVHSDMPWDGQGPEYAQVDLKEESVAPFRRD